MHGCLNHNFNQTTQELVMISKNSQPVDSNQGQPRSCRLTSLTVGAFRKPPSRPARRLLAAGPASGQRPADPCAESPVGASIPAARQLSAALISAGRPLGSATAQCQPGTPRAASPSRVHARQHAAASAVRHCGPYDRHGKLICA